ncbi:MAG: zinc ABC transporter substrate-binding protein [Magnetococcales bacterium]|nr:zinc ABC transporter substrate-binding protein [Magnetococcales bacterium]
MIFRKGLALLLALGTLLPFPAPALEVVASIKPFHALTAAIMGETGTPSLLIRGNGSPHTYALRPSDARLLEGADLIVWGGPALEGFLSRPLDNLPKKALLLPLLATEGLNRLSARQGGAWSGEAGHDDHADHADHAEKHHQHGPVDPHIWLDPDNAVMLGSSIAASLGRLDPARVATYRRNAETLAGRLKELDRELATLLAPVRERPFIVFHDAYHYFEQHYGLKAAGSLLVDAERPPGARRIQAISKRIQESGAQCLFTEPQFPQRLAATVTENRPLRLGVLDPLGAGLTDGPELYFQLMRNLARALLSCLTSG